MLFLWTLGATAAAAMIATIWLFLHRDPDIATERFDGYLCPADGTVSDIITITGTTHRIRKGTGGITAILQDTPWAGTIILIVMRPHDIHTQRAPVRGVITSVSHKPGRKRNAVFGDFRAATVENEHAAITIEGARPCKLYLIAGLLARRIKPVVRAGQRVEQGERVGSIAFGSQVAVVLPHCRVLVKEGEHVRVGKARLAR